MHGNVQNIAAWFIDNLDMKKKKKYSISYEFHALTIDVSHEWYFEILYNGKMKYELNSQYLK